MKIKQINDFSVETFFESLQPGEYYVWTVHLDDGTTEQIEATDYTTEKHVQELFAKEGKQVIKIDYNFGIQGGQNNGMDQRDRRDYHKQQDKHEKDTLGQGQRFTGYTQTRESDEVFEDVKSKWQELNELSVNTMSTYRDATANPRTTDRLGKVVKHVRGHNQAINKIAKATGDKTPHKDYARTVESGEQYAMAAPEMVRAAYDRMISLGLSPEDARKRAPNSAAREMRQNPKNNSIPYRGGKVGQTFAPNHKSGLEEQELNELSSELLGKYKKAASADASKADVAGNTAQGNKRFSGIVKATNKQFDNDKKAVREDDEPQSIYSGPEYQKWSQDATARGLTLNRPGVSRGPGTVGYNAGSGDPEARTPGQLTPNRSAGAGDNVDYIDATDNQGNTVGHWSTKGGGTTGGILGQSPEHYQQLASKGFNTEVQPSNIAAGVQEALMHILGEDFTGILNRQHNDNQAAKIRKTVEIPFHGWVIRYRPASNPGDKVIWQAMDKRGEVKHKGESETDKDAVADAESWITKGGDAKQQATSNVTIDFNVDFAKEFSPEGETFYATIDSDKGVPTLIVSTEPQQGFKTSHIRTQAHKVGAGTTKLPTISLSAKEANNVGLQANGRYILGPKDPIDDHVTMFPLIFQNIVQGKGDMMKMGKPGLTVAHNRD